MKLEEFKNYIHPNEDIVLRDEEDINFECAYNRKSEMAERELKLEDITCYTVLEHLDKLVIKLKGLKELYKKYKVGDYVELYTSMFRHKIVYSNNDEYVVKNCSKGSLKIVPINEIEREWK